MNFDAIRHNLEKRGYKVSCFQTTSDAADYLNSIIDGKTVGFGGSVTLAEMGLFDLLAKHNDVRWHNRIPEGKTPLEMRALANAAEIYLTSVNGIAETGEIINIDGAGNRVASTFYGHEKVFFVVGSNKIAGDYESALYRARNVAAPLNAQRLGKKTPCAVKADRCYDCDSPDRICCGLSVFWCKPTVGEYEVILIDEKLGY